MATLPPLHSQGSTGAACVFIPAVSATCKAGIVYSPLAMSMETSPLSVTITSLSWVPWSTTLLGDSPRHSTRLCASCINWCLRSEKLSPSLVHWLLGNLATLMLKPWDNIFRFYILSDGTVTLNNKRVMYLEVRVSSRCNMVSNDWLTWHDLDALTWLQLLVYCAYWPLQPHVLMPRLPKHLTPNLKAIKFVCRCM